MLFLRMRPMRDGVGYAEMGLTWVDDRTRTREGSGIATARREGVVPCVSEGLA